ncbi:hypothetical protein B0H17DRAFT_1151653 [Mycena rosella]|uniref:Uncharacterized protein n=1 Tax=Mycena rosella TaxID=1033263 RepID=A0AAD7BJN1_MYCRO|nr:hypothetical protein B0H17DRAFT_1151653 [Mycena rosella]
MADECLYEANILRDCMGRFRKYICRRLAELEAARAERKLRSVTGTSDSSDPLLVPVRYIALIAMHDVPSVFWAAPDVEPKRGADFSVLLMTEPAETVRFSDHIIIGSSIDFEAKSDATVATVVNSEKKQSSWNGSNSPEKIQTQWVESKCTETWMKRRTRDRTEKEKNIKYYVKI